MKCPRCGNEVNQNEVFCGQCGAPTMPPARPTEAVSAPPPLSSRQLNNYATPSSFAPPQNGPNTRQIAGNKQSSYPSLPPQVGNGPANTSGGNAPASFHQDATESISALPGGWPGQVMPPQNFPGTQAHYPAGTGYYGGGSVQQPPYQAGNYTNQAYGQAAPSGGAEQAYMYDRVERGKAATQKAQPGNTTVLIVSLSIAIVIIAVLGLGVLFVLKGQSNNQTTGSGAGNVAAAPTGTIVPTMVPTPTPTMAPTPTPTVAITPTPTLPPTPAPDANFQWCTPACAALGYQIEYPMSWSPGATTGIQGYQYINPAAADEIVAVKVAGQTTMQPGDLLNQDLQTNFQAKPGYMGPASTPTTTTIGGTIWLMQTVSYQNNQMQVRVMVYSTVYQQKGYIIEIQANDAQFDMVNQQTFMAMLKSFSFQAIPAA